MSRIKAYQKSEDLTLKPDEFLECYDLGHSWKVFGWVRNGTNGLIRKNYCITCLSERHDMFRRRSGRPWHKENMRYLWAEGYLLKGEGRVSKVEKQRESIRRAFATDAVSEADDLALADA